MKNKFPVQCDLSVTGENNIIYMYIHPILHTFIISNPLGRVYQCGSLSFSTQTKSFIEKQLNVEWRVQ